MTSSDEFEAPSKPFESLNPHMSRRTESSEATFSMHRLLTTDHASTPPQKLREARVQTNVSLPIAVARYLEEGVAAASPGTTQERYFFGLISKLSPTKPPKRIPASVLALLDEPSVQKNFSSTEPAKAYLKAVAKGWGRGVTIRMVAIHAIVRDHKHRSAKPRRKSYRLVGGEKFYEQ